MNRLSSLLKTKLFPNKTKKNTPTVTAARSVAIPMALRPYFESHTYTPVHLSGEQHFPIVKMVQLSSDGNPGQAVFREDTLLDLDVLKAHTGKDFRRMSRNQYHRVLLRTRVNLIPPIPALTDHPTWVDDSVDDLDYALVDITGQREFMVVAKAVLDEWLADLPRMDIAMPVQQIDPTDGEMREDNDKINASIRKLTKLRIERRLKDTLDLPPLPDVARRLIELRSNPNGNLHELVSVIEADPVLAANVMRWANSSMYANAGRVHSVHDAVSRVLGYDMVMNLLMGLVLGDVMRIPDHRTTHVLGFWEQAMWVAHGAAALAELLPAEKAAPKGVVYLTGLLHNFGYLVLSHTFPRTSAWSPNPPTSTATWTSVWWTPTSWASPASRWRRSCSVIG